MKLNLLLLLLTLNSCSKEVNPEFKAVHQYLAPYYEEFLELTGHVNTSEVVVLEFSRLMPDGVLGMAIGMNVDGLVFIKINANYWDSLSENQRWWLVMHELSHDILNLRHGHNILMDTPMPRHVNDFMISIARADLKK